MRPELGCSATTFPQRIEPEVQHILRRRWLLAAIAGLPIALADAAMGAQGHIKRVVVGWLQITSMQTNATTQNIAAFKEALTALGWREGAHYVIEARSAEGRPERLPELARELAALRPAVLIATSGQAGSILAKAAPSIPIVQVSGTNPVETGRADSLARPGGMTTGITSIPAELGEKLVELLVAIVPQVKRVGFLVPFSTQAPHEASSGPLEAARRSAARFNVEAQIAHPSTVEAIEVAMKGFVTRGVQALIVMANQLLTAERSRIMAFAQAQRWPVLAQSRGWPPRGALLSYGANTRQNYRRAAYYADRILKGAKPGELPIEQPREFELVLNLRTAKTLGLTVPQSVLVQATRVIE
jgi:putative ABC transport system substrate-binding protein